MPCILFLGLGKKLDALSKQKGCETVGLWRQSVTNHLYWVAASTPGGDGEVMKAKWESIMNHIQDKHVHDNALFASCAHDPLDNPDREWLKPNTKPSVKLEELLLNKTLLKDIGKLSPGCQTSSLEAFHSLILKFAPKHTSFSNLGMQSRLYLAALHYNENSDRMQAVTKSGHPQYSLRFPKFKKGGYTIKVNKCGPTYRYTSVLVQSLFEGYRHSPAALQGSIAHVRAAVPPSLAAAMERPVKEQAVAAHVSRFAR